MILKLYQKQIKNIANQIHLWLGLTTGIIIFTISVTGCIYVFEEEIRAFTDQQKSYVPIQDKPFVGLDKVVQNFQKEVPNEKITLIRINEKVPNATVELSTKKKAFYFNPYDGTLIESGDYHWLNTVKKLHTNLLLGETGGFIQRWSVVIFTLMLLTGIVLWFPNKIKSLKQSLTIKWKGKFRRVNYDFHKVLGFYASFILIIIALTGLFFAFKEVKNAAAFLTGTELTDGKEVDSKVIPQKEPLAMRYDRIYRTAIQKYPGATTTTLSIKKNGDLRLKLLYPYEWSRNQNTFYFNATTGQLLRYKLYKEYNTADILEASNYEIHTGRFFGVFGKIVAFLASLISASLPVTGFIIWLKKKKKTNNSKNLLYK